MPSSRRPGRSRRRTEQLLDGHGPAGDVADLLATARHTRLMDPAARGDEREQQALAAFRAAAGATAGTGRATTPTVAPTGRPTRALVGAVAVACALLFVVAAGAAGMRPGGPATGAVAATRAAVTLPAPVPSAPAPPPAPPTSRTAAARVLPTLSAPPRPPRTPPTTRDGVQPPPPAGRDARRTRAMLVEACLWWPRLPGRYRDRYLRLEPFRTMVRTAGSVRRVPVLCSEVLHRVQPRP